MALETRWGAKTRRLTFANAQRPKKTHCFKNAGAFWGGLLRAAIPFNTHLKTTSQKTLPLPPVGQHLLDNLLAAAEVQPVKPFAQLPRLGVAHEDRIAQRERLFTSVFDGRLNLASPFERGELCA